MRARKYHQGDVLLIPATIPANAKFLNDEIVQWGEITGHTHKLEKSKIYEAGNRKFVRVMVAEPMTHEDHPPTSEIKKGDYEIIIQNEYFPDGVKKVID